MRNCSVYKPSIGVLGSDLLANTMST